MPYIKYQNKYPYMDNTYTPIIMWFSVHLHYVPHTKLCLNYFMQAVIQGKFYTQFNFINYLDLQ